MKKMSAALFLTSASFLPLQVQGDAPMGFLRGDANCDGGIDLGDGIRTIRYLFLGEEITCLDAADFDATGELDLTDPVGLLGYLFLDGAPPRPPFPECGATEATAKSLGCARPTCEVKDPGGELVWLGRPDGCYQCEPCETPTLPEVIRELGEMGIEVFGSKEGFPFMVCMACSVCPTGIYYFINVRSGDVPALESMGWWIWTRPV